MIGVNDLSTSVIDSSINTDGYLTITISWTDVKTLIGLDSTSTPSH